MIWTIFFEPHHFEKYEHYSKTLLAYKTSQPTCDTSAALPSVYQSNGVNQGGGGGGQRLLLRVTLWRIHKNYIIKNQDVVLVLYMDLHHMRIWFQIIILHPLLVKYYTKLQHLIPEKISRFTQVQSLHGNGKFHQDENDPWWIQPRIMTIWNNLDVVKTFGLVSLIA